MVDGHSLASFLTGDAETTRDWIFAYQADRRIVRTERWLLEDNSPRHYGRLFDCGTSRDGMGYRDVTKSSEHEVVAAKKAIDALLTSLPAPLLDHDGPPNQKLNPKARSAEQRDRPRRRTN